MSRVALGLAYDGSAWQGWQTQPHGQTVQDTLEAALASFCGVPGTVPTICAGRTDTGVHGAMQVVHLDTALDRRMESWVRGVNAFLPPSISVQWAKQVPDDFHARFSARSRTYVYLLWRGRVHVPMLGRDGVLAVQALDPDGSALHRLDVASLDPAALRWLRPLADPQRIVWMGSQLRAGVVWSNSFNRFDPASPFGGYKESGYGREGGRHGLEGYLQ